MTAQILHFRDYKSREQRELESAQAEQRRFEGGCFPFAADGGPVVAGDPNQMILDRLYGVPAFVPIDLPSDCPA